MTNTTEIARAMASTMEHAAIPMYGKKLRLPDRSSLIRAMMPLRSGSRSFFPSMGMAPCSLVDATARPISVVFVMLLLPLTT